MSGIGVLDQKLSVVFDSRLRVPISYATLPFLTMGRRRKAESLFFVELTFATGEYLPPGQSHGSKAY